MGGGQDCSKGPTEHLWGDASQLDGLWSLQVDPKYYLRKEAVVIGGFLSTFWALLNLLI